MNEFDNQITYKIRTAQELNIPSKYIYLDNDIFYSVKDYIRNNINKPFVEIYEDVNKLNIQLPNVNILMLYIEVLTETGYPQEDLITYLTQLIKELHTILDDDDTLVFSLYADIQALIDDYTNWKKNYNQELDKERIKYEKIAEIQKSMSEVAPLVTSDIKIITTENTYQVVFLADNRKPTNLDGLDMFVGVIPNVQVPFIQYNGESDTEPLVRVYKGLSEDNDKVPLQFVLQNVEKNDKDNTFYITLHIGEDLTTDSQTYYLKLSYNLDKGTINLPTRQDANFNQRIINRFLQTFPMLTLINPVETKLDGEFTITGMIVDPEVLFVLTLNYLTISTYLYIDETGSAFCEKKRFSMHYKSVTFEEEQDTDDDNVIFNPYSATITFPALSENAISTQRSKLSEETGKDQEQTIKVRIKVKNREILKQFMVIFPRLMAIYMNIKPEVIESLKSISTEAAEAEIKMSREHPTIYTKVKNLTHIASEVFKDFKNEIGNVYSRACTCPFQPIIVSDDEVEAWRSKYISVSGKGVERTILEYPPDQSKYNFVCPSDTYPYPYGIQNYGSNKKDFPYVPCCGGTEINKKRLENFEEVKLNPPEEQVIAKSKEKYHTKSLKKQEPGRYGSLPKSLLSLLQVGFSGMLYDFNRLGVNKSSSSLLHCLCIGIQDPIYEAFVNQIDKENHVIKIRQNLANSLNLSIFKQEMYNYTIEQIKDVLLDSNVFLDPHLFYRGLEEYFNVNIYVFNPEGPANPIEGITEDTTGPVLEIPRCVITHIRIARPDRKTIIILKYPNYNQCELIISRGVAMAENVEENEEDEEECCVDKPNKTEKYGLVPKVIGEGFIYNFGPEMEKVLYTSLQNILDTYSINYPYTPNKNQGNEQTYINPKDINVYHNMYPKVNWLNVFKRVEIVGQKIDSYGKVRILQINYSGNVVTLWVPPSQPLNVPIIGEITSTTETIARQLLGTPSGVTLEGLWFSYLDYSYGIFIPCEVKSRAEITVPPPPIKARVIDFQGPVDELRKKQRLASILIQMLWYLWKVEGNLSLQDWWNKYVVRDDNVIADYPENIVRLLPKVNTSRDAILIFHTWWPTYFYQDGKVHLYDKLYDTSLAYLLREEQMSNGLDIEVPEKLSGLYIWMSDFPSFAKTLLFNQQSTYSDWVKSNQSSTEFNKIIGEVPLDISTSTDPKIYHRDNNMFIVQNVRNGELARALALSLFWKQTGINRGYDVDPINSINIVHMIYGLSKISTIVPAEDKTAGHEDYLEVLYMNGRYLGLLRLL
jgi:hypothetical protein